MKHDTFKGSDPANHELLKELRTIMIGSMNASHEAIAELDRKGLATQEVKTNQFGERALAADVASEDVMIEKFGEASCPVLVISEEHKPTELHSEIEAPRILVVMDGLDGSGNKGKDNNYGVMCAVFENDTPRYNECLIAAIGLPNGDILLAERGKGVVLIKKSGGEERQFTDQTASLDQAVQPVVFADKTPTNKGDKLHEFFRLNTILADQLEVNMGVASGRSGSIAGNIVKVAKGEAALDIGATRKGNLEYATAWLVINEAGGVIETFDGDRWKDLGGQEFLSYGQQDHVPVVMSANPMVAEQFRNAMNF
jgi:fructose-1,6-bisphosphatase/inositol monophosphatase family enzyme